jgi:autotransporter-associated beta strand protein
VTLSGLVSALNLMANVSETIGALTVNSGGTVTTGASSTLTTGPLAVNSGASVTTGATSTLTAGPLAMDGGTITTGSGSQLVLSGNVSGSADATIGGSGTLSLGGSDRTFSPSSGVNLTISIPITGTGGLTKDGAGTLDIKPSSPDSPDTYTGTTTVNVGILQLDKTAGVNAVPGPLVITGGTLSLGSNEQIADSAPVTVNGGGTLALNGFSETIGSLSGSGTIDLGGGSLTVNSNNTSSTFSGLIKGPGTLTKAGSGTLHISGTGTSSGQIIVSAGEVDILNNTNQPNVSVQVMKGGTLGGTGTVGSGEVLSGGTLAPGTNSALGVLTFHGPLTLHTGSVVAERLNNDTQAGQGYDQIRVAGQLTLGDPMGGSPTLNLAVGPNFSASSPDIGKPSITLIQTGGGPIAGTFVFTTGQPLAGGSLFVRGIPPSGFVLELSYQDDNGNNVGLANLDSKQLFIRSLFDAYQTPLNETQRNNLHPLDLGTIVGRFLNSPNNRMATLNTFYRDLGLPLPSSNDPTYNGFVQALLNGNQAGKIFAKLAASRQFKAMGHPKNRAYVNGLVAAVLGSPRAFSRRQRDLWVQGLTQGTLSRADVAEQLLATEQVYTQAIVQNYQAFLNRRPSGTELATALAMIKQGLNPDGLSTQLLESGEHLGDYVKSALAGNVTVVGPNNQTQPLVAIQV